MQQLSLTGDLREFGVDDVLSLLEWGKTGTLSVKHGQEEIAVSFVKGAIADAVHAGIPTLTFAEVLNRAGYLTPQQLQEVSIIRLGNQRRVGAVLANLGLVPEQVLEEYLRLRIRNAIRHLFIWQEGAFDFQRGVPVLGAGPSLQMDVKGVIADGRNAQAEWGKLAARIHGMDYGVQLVGERMKDVSPSHFSPAALRVINLADGRSSIRMIGQCLFLDDLQAARAVEELLSAGIATLADSVAAAPIDVQRPSAGSDKGEDDFIRLLAKSQVIPHSTSSEKPGDRIKALLRALQDCVNDLLVYQDSQYRSTLNADSSSKTEEYLEQRFGEVLTELQAQFSALGALQVINRRVDTSDLVETYNLILGETRQTFYLEAVQGLAALVKAIFDWVISDEVDGRTIAAECQEAWATFFGAIETKVTELTVADGWGKKAPPQSKSRRG